VVVGAGLGGLKVAEQLRRQKFTGPITLLGAEARPPYDRPPLSKAVLHGTMDDTTLRRDLSTLELDLRLGQPGRSLDPATRTVVLESGATIGYDVLVLAPGAVPKLPPDVRPGPGVHVLRTIEDSLRLRGALAEGGPVAVVGAGFVGCEVAAAARRLDVDVHVVERLPLPLIRVLGEAGARHVADLHTSRGVRLHTGTGSTVVRAPDGVEGVRLDDGTELACRHVVYGIGVSPEVEWLSASGIDLDDGIVCDELGRTSLAGVYALGDAARWFQPLVSGHRRIEHWMSAAGQADVVARSIVAGGEVSVAPTVPFFWSDQYDVKIQGLGFVDASDDIQELAVGGRPVLVYSRDGTLRAVVGFSAPTAVLPMRKSILSGVDVEEAVHRLTE
jgi:3-phenylpropionate/trans-cinnamate dioxygenase ferredoxin reductase subunit